MSADDVIKELEEMITETQKKIGVLQADKAKIDEQLKEAEGALSALRTVYGMKARSMGRTKVPLFTGKGTTFRFAGMKLTKALELLKKERPGINKKQAHDILIKEGFNFRTNRTRTAVHAAWTALGLRKKRR